MTDKKGNSNFVEREWNEGIKGEYDEDGFFITPNGSFWDPDYVYFNREGYDKHGGRYNDNGEYIPGKGWDNENNCYESEKEDDFDEFDEEEEGFNKNFNIGNEEAIDDLEDDLFDIDINEDNIQQIIKECSPFNDKNEEKKKDEKNEKKEEDKAENEEKEETKEKVEKEEIEEKDVKKEKEENNEKKDENKDIKDKERKDKLEEKKDEKKNNSKEKNNTKQKGKIIIFHSFFIYFFHIKL